MKNLMRILKTGGGKQKTPFTLEEQTCQIINKQSYIWENSQKTKQKIGSETIKTRSNDVLKCGNLCFIEALNEQFVSNDYTTQAYNELQNLKYNNNIEDLVAKYRCLATKAKITGSALREPFIYSLLAVIQIRLSLAEPTGDD